MRTRSFCLGAAAVLLAFGVFAAVEMRPPAGPQPTATRFSLPDVEIITPARERRHGTLRVHDGVIGAETYDGNAADEPAVAGLVGTFVLPGIIDLHTHLPAKTPIALTEYFGLLHVAHGVTTVRDAGDIEGTAIPAARDAFERRGAIGPRVIACGPFVGGPNPRWANEIVVERPEQAKDVVARLVREGSGCIKLYDGLDRDTLRALIVAAADAGLPALGHVPYGLTIEDAPIPDVQHLMGVPHPEDIAAGNHVVHRIIDWHAVDDARLQEVVRYSVEHHIAHTPTLVANARLLLFADPSAARDDPVATLLPRMYTDVAWSPAIGLGQYRGFAAAEVAEARATLAKKERLVRMLHEAGVRLHIGTDTQQPFVVPGAAAQQEMRLFAESGVPVEDVWADATWRAADVIKVPDLGRLVAGAPADFLVFRRDPTKDLAALDTLAAVSVGGRLYLRADLDAAIERYRAYYRRALVDRLSVWRARSVLATVKSAH